MASVTWLGQMGLRIRMGDTTILVDYFASDLQGRRIPAPVPVGEMKDVDGFVGTHDHVDHIDHEVWRRWGAICRDDKFVFPSIHRRSILDDGIPEKRHLPIDAGQSVRIGDITIHAMPAAHEFLSPDDLGRYPCLQYIIEGEGKRVYHAGDTLR